MSMSGAAHGPPPSAPLVPVSDRSVRAVARARRLRPRLDALPLPGTGRTEERWRALARLGGCDLSTARIAEGHVDARAILVELGQDVPDGLLGVWAAEPAGLQARPSSDGWVLAGEKGWCSGSTDLDHALVAATAPDGPRLFLLDPSALEVVPGSWQPLGMDESRSDTLRFADVAVPAEAAVGEPGAYVERPGFGHGGCGVAAVWWGGAAAVLDALRTTVAEADDEDPYRTAALGWATAGLEGAGAALARAAAVVDQRPHEPADHLALVVRLVVGRAVQDVLGVVTRALGARGLCHRPDHARRVADLMVYVSQLNPDRSATALGRAARTEPWVLAR